MSLRFTGNENETLTGINLRAEGSNGVLVVKVSVEVIQDFGLDKAKSVACDKYSSKSFDADGNIVVRTTDCT